MVFHDFADSVDVCFRFVIFYFHIFQFIAALFKESKDTLFLFLIKIFQFCNHACQHLSDFAHILGPHIVQCVFRKVGNFLLAAGPVLHHHLGIGNVYLGGEAVHHLLLLRCQDHFRNFGFLLLQGLRTFLWPVSSGKGGKGQSRGFF